MQPVAAGIAIAVRSSLWRSQLLHADSESQSCLIPSASRVRTFGKKPLGEGRRINTYRGIIGDGRAPENNLWDSDKFQNDETEDDIAAVEIADHYVKTVFRNIRAVIPVATNALISGYHRSHTRLSN
jgi:hypothetical protein